MKIKNYIIYKIIIIFVINIFLCHFIGKIYLSRFNIFINENNNIFIKKEINNIVKNNPIDISNNLYNIIYNDSNEIVNVDLNVNSINKYLSKYIKILNDELNSSS